MSADSSKNPEGPCSHAGQSSHGRKLNQGDGRSGEHTEDAIGSTRTQIRALELAGQGLRATGGTVGVRLTQ